MILSRLFTRSKNKKQEWLKDKEARLEQEFNAELEKKKEDLFKNMTFENERISEMEKRVKDKRLELERTNEDLKDQIRLIEAKATPDAIWASAFSLGWSKAWDTMAPIQQDGVIKAKERIRTSAYEECLGNLEETVLDRLRKIGKANLRKEAEIVSKREDIASLMKSTSKEENRMRYKYHLEALDWILNGNVLSE